MLVAKNFIEGIRLGRTFSPVGANAYISTAQSKFGGTSYFSNGTDSYYLTNQLTGLAFGTGDFTIEFWWYAINNTQSIALDFRPQTNQGPYATMFWDGTGKMAYFVNSGSRISGALSPNTWHNVAVVRASSVTKMYFNGTALATTYADTTNYLAPRCYIGGNSRVPPASIVNGYMDELRVSNIARYTSNFTPATAPFIDDVNTLLLCHFDGPNGSFNIVDDNT